MIAVSNAHIQYFVEGDDEKKLINTLKNDLKVIKPGKVQILNVVQNIISDMIIRTFKPKTVVVLIFDTDTSNTAILDKNIAKLKKYRNVTDIVTIPQVKNLEDELTYSCDIKKITELLNSRSASGFKSDLLHVTNLGYKLQEHSFDINRFWSKQPRAPYKHIINDADKVKIISK